MGFRQTPASSYRISEALSSDTTLSDTVRKILNTQREEAKHLIGGTTLTAFRRIHDHLTAVFDRAVGILASPSSKEASTNEIIVGLTKGLILVEYQLSRRQISVELGNKLKEILTILLNSFGKSESVKMFERARTLLDAYTVLVYKYAR